MSGLCCVRVWRLVLAAELVNFDHIQFRIPTFLEGVDCFLVNVIGSAMASAIIAATTNPTNIPTRKDRRQALVVFLCDFSTTCFSGVLWETIGASNARSGAVSIMVYLQFLDAI